MPHVSGPSAAFGSVPTMNHSSTAPVVGRRQTGPRIDLEPDKAIGGPREVGPGHLAVASLRKPCQTKVETSIEKSGAFAVETKLLSELPFQTPTARA